MPASLLESFLYSSVFVGSEYAFPELSSSLICALTFAASFPVSAILFLRSTHFEESVLSSPVCSMLFISPRTYAIDLDKSSTSYCIALYVRLFLFPPVARNFSCLFCNCDSLDRNSSNCFVASLYCFDGVYFSVSFSFSERF